MEAEIFVMMKKYAEAVAKLNGTGAFCKMIVSIDGVIYETRTGCDLKRLQAEDVAIAAVDTDFSIEYAILREEDDCQALVLSKPVYCMKFAENGAVLPASLDDMAQIVGPCAETVPYESSAMHDALCKASGCFVKGRYTLCKGRSLFEAVTCLEVLEKQAEVHLKAQVLGGAAALCEAEVVQMRRHYLQQYSRVEHAEKSREGRRQ